MINPNNYTAQQIDDVLRMKTHSRNVTFRYDLLDRNDIKIGELDGVEACKITYGTFRPIKRTADFRLNEYLQREIDFLTNRIRPNFILHMPDGGTVEWGLGVFLLESPARDISGNIKKREIGAYDKLLVLEQDGFERRLFIGAGTKYTAAITMILNTANINRINIRDTDLELLADREFAMDMNKKEIINTLLSEINYTSLWIDETGFVRAEQYVPPALRPVDHIYAADKHSIMHPKFTENLDLANRANVFIRVARNLEQDKELKAVFVNDNPESIISTVRRGRRIRNFEEMENAASQEVLDALVERIAIESTSAYSHFEFETALMPNHGDSDTLLCSVPGVLDTPTKFSEMSWEMDLKFGGVMRHTARKLVHL